MWRQWRFFLAGKTNEDEGLETGAIDDMDATVMMHLADSVGSSENEDEEVTVLGNVYSENWTRPDEDDLSRLGTIRHMGEDDEVVLEHWRSSTPERGTIDSRYEEERPP